MNFFCTRILTLTGACLLGVSASAQETQQERVAKLERENRSLRLQLENLNKGYASALVREQTQTQSLKEIKQHLALFGKGFFEGADEKLRNAVSDYQVAREDLTSLEASTTDLLISMQYYLRTAVSSDPEARADVESKMRQLQVDLGHRNSPKRQIEQGNVSRARVVSVDSESGLLIINAGEDADVRPGMQFRILRADT
ncbi:hypothetical protein N9224_02185, partial [Akkermansiaceae bacterium]|nr:hypothetical protein [Akkermansiaceae bacterium]